MEKELALAAISNLTGAHGDSFCLIEDHINGLKFEDERGYEYQVIPDEIFDQYLPNPTVVKIIGRYEGLTVFRHIKQVNMQIVTLDEEGYYRLLEYDKVVDKVKLESRDAAWEYFQEKGLSPLPTEAYTFIYYNGPILQPERTVADLLATLQEKPLSPQFEKNFIKKENGLWLFAGAFSTIQYRFRIETNHPQLITQLSAAIHQNLKRRSYLVEKAKYLSTGLRIDLVKHVENSGNSDSEIVKYLKEKYNISGRPSTFPSIYKEFEWIEGKWISIDDVIYCAVDLGFRRIKEQAGFEEDEIVMDFRLNGDEAEILADFLGCNLRDVLVWSDGSLTLRDNDEVEYWVLPKEVRTDPRHVRYLGDSKEYILYKSI